MNKPTKLFLWSSTCFMTWLSTGCQPSKALTASRPVPSLIPAVELPAQASSINPEPQGVAPAPSPTASAPDTPVELDLGKCASLGPQEQPEHPSGTVEHRQRPGHA